MKIERPDKFKGLSKQQIQAMFLAKCVRDELEGFQGTTLGDDDAYPAINRAIRNAIYSGMKLWDEAMDIASVPGGRSNLTQVERLRLDYCGIKLSGIPEYWEPPVLEFGIYPIAEMATPRPQNSPPSGE